MGTILNKMVKGLARGCPGSATAGGHSQRGQSSRHTQGARPRYRNIRNPADRRFASVFAGLKSRAQALYVVTDPFMASNRVRINTLALSASLPTIHGIRDYVEVGGLMSYAASFPDLWRRAGDYVDKILRGTKPADLPVEQPTKFDLTINLVTAQALGLTIPSMLLARADEVIE
jgi:ABC-type uncharacterized transport system substrate-binding protein